MKKVLTYKFYLVLHCSILIVLALWLAHGTAKAQSGINRDELISI